MRAFIAQLKYRAHSEPGRRGDRTLDHLAAIRRIQEHLVGHAARNGVPVCDLAHPAELTQQVVDAVVADLSAPQRELA